MPTHSTMDMPIVVTMSKSSRSMLLICKWAAKNCVTVCKKNTNTNQRQIPAAKPMNAIVAGQGGDNVTVEMGSYGIGVSRLVGGIIEASHDDAGIVWPESVAPFQVAIVNLKPDDGGVSSACVKLYESLQAKGVDVLHDDRDVRPGAKFADMDLIGLPWQVIIGPKGLAAGKVELKNRKSGVREELPLDQVLARFG